jgi:hypothetical protein
MCPIVAPRGILAARGKASPRMKGIIPGHHRRTAAITHRASGPAFPLFTDSTIVLSPIHRVSSPVTPLP